MKNTIKFTFTIPISETKISTAGCVETVQIGEYTIQGQYWEKHEFDYDRILWNGCDIYDLAMNTNEGEAIREMIDAATDDHVNYLIEKKNQMYPKEDHIIKDHNTEGYDSVDSEDFDPGFGGRLIEKEYVPVPPPKIESELTEDEMSYYYMTEEQRNREAHEYLMKHGVNFLQKIIDNYK